ncbi:MAG: hypothetical protein ABL308_13675 [Oceanicaulis sp.]
MAGFDPGAAFWPNRRADADTFLLALGIIAAIDAVRLTLLPVGGLLTWLLVMFFVVSAFINRARDAGRGGGAAVLAAGSAAMAKAVASFIAITAALYPDFLRFMEQRGVDVSDPVAVQAAASDMALQQAYQERLQTSPELMGEIYSAGAWPSMWAFWIVIALFAWRLRRLPSRPQAVR